MGEKIFFFVSDLHGDVTRYRKLVSRIRDERPTAVFLGGDLLPSHLARLAGTGLSAEEFVTDHLVPEFSKLREHLGPEYPALFLILGNDDPRSAEEGIEVGVSAGLWHYAHGRILRLQGHDVYGYSYVPPTPFNLKDWERYDVSEFVDPGCIHPTEGWRTVPVPQREIKLSTIKKDLEILTRGNDLSGAVMLFHTPPYRTSIDRAALDGKFVDHVPLDVHVGSIAVRELIEERQPLVTLHGHVHESAGITGQWKEMIGRTTVLSAAHDGPELALVRFSAGEPSGATRELV
jgi:Icc-related predicted phosphoesterase